MTRYRDNGQTAEKPPVDVEEEKIIVTGGSKRNLRYISGCQIKMVT